MVKAFLYLMSREGDRMGHLVRAVQMLRSYGHETKVVGYADVVDVPGADGQPDTLYTVLEILTAAELDGLQGICRETAWSLGHKPEVLTIGLATFGDRRFDPLPGPVSAQIQRQPVTGGTLVMDRHAFAHEADWGQQLPDGETRVQGEWPSATGR